MSVSHVIEKIVSFLRAGHLPGVAPTDTFPVLALLRRRLSNDEVGQVVTGLVDRGDIPVDATDIRVTITRFTDQMPSPDEVDRVKQRLRSRGWPVSERLPRRT